jgi:ADP-ribosylglycohydrolase
LTLPSDYLERVYAGVLGKIIGVYLGRPFEGWSYERITAELGEIRGYVHERLGVPLIVTDDDISGTFTFIRALADYGFSREITPAQIGQAWLNYLIENKTILWWGGLGRSTEHTAYLRLKAGVPAPRSGSAALNGKIVAEQIGAQIFIDGWAMVAPGNPDLAADLARRAASVSHDGEAIYGAQALAVMESLAFVEHDRQKLIEAALTHIPNHSTIYRMIQEIREQHAAEPDWRKTRAWFDERYGYGKYIGGCHIVPNHGLILLGLLYGDDDFQKSLMVVNTAGWDTDCNSGNLGCLMGIKNGLAGIDASPVDWRGPLADRLYNAAADGGRVVSDAVLETYAIANAGRALAGLAPLRPKGGARFHFSLPGSLQGFQTAGPRARITNRDGKLDILCSQASASEPARVSTPTFLPPTDLAMPGYTLMACPTLYPGQMVRAAVQANPHHAAALPVRLVLSHYGTKDALATVQGPEVILAPGEIQTLTWRVPETGGEPITEIGLEIAAPGALALDWLTWEGAPDANFTRPAASSRAWRASWMNAMDHWESNGQDAFRLIQDSGRGLLIHGAREWSDYEVSAEIYPTLIQAAGLAARVQGLRRYYALLLVPEGRVRLVRVYDDETILAEAEIGWQPYQIHHLALQVTGNSLVARVNGSVVFDLRDNWLKGGAIALVCEEGHCSTNTVRVREIEG